MNDIVDIKRHKRSSRSLKTPSLRDYFGDDDWLLALCAQWRAARAQQQKNWAEHALATGWGTLPDADIELDLDPLARMRELQSQLENVEPRTILLARELLRIALTILVHQREDAESPLSDGPVLDVVRNVLSSLDWLPGETRLGPEPKLADN